MKKWITLILCVCIAFGSFFSLSACTQNPPDGGSGDGWEIGYY